MRRLEQDQQLLRSKEELQLKQLRMQQIERDLLRESPERRIHMSQRREEKLLRLKREQREQERRRQEQHSKML